MNLRNLNIFIQSGTLEKQPPPQIPPVITQRVTAHSTSNCMDVLTCFTMFIPVIFFIFFLGGGGEGVADQ